MPLLGKENVTLRHETEDEVTPGRDLSFDVHQSVQAVLLGLPGPDRVKRF